MVDGFPTAEVQTLLAASFDDFSADDWLHCLGGVQLLLWDSAGLVGHAAVVPRSFWCAGQELRVGYVEGLAVRANSRRRGHASALMAAVEAQPYDVLALSTTDSGMPFYLARAWQPWRGPTAVRTPSGVVRTPEDDGSVLVFAASLDLDAELVCDWRTGDVW